MLKKGAIWRGVFPQYVDLTGWRWCDYRRIHHSSLNHIWTLTSFVPHLKLWGSSSTMCTESRSTGTYKHHWRYN